MELLPKLIESGVKAIKIEGRQRSTVYVEQVTRIWRAALDACQRDPAHYRPREEWLTELGKVSEGTQTTLGAYHRPWQ
jgi:putative protease